KGEEGACAAQAGPLIPSHWPQPWPLQEHRDGDRQAGGWLIAARAHYGSFRVNSRRQGAHFHLRDWSQFDRSSQQGCRSGDDSRLPALAAELVSLKPRVLFTYSPQAATAAAEATRNIPIIVGSTSGPTLTALAGGSIGRPTTNVTGFVLISPEI